MQGPRYRGSHAFFSLLPAGTVSEQQRRRQRCIGTETQAAPDPEPRAQSPGPGNRGFTDVIQQRGLLSNSVKAH